MTNTLNVVWNTDLVTLCDLLEPQSVDMILADLPYQVTQASWDVMIPLDAMWAGFRRVIKPCGAIVLTSVQPFTSMLVMSNLRWYHEELCWNKVLANGFLDANRKHMRQHENVIVFCEGMPPFEPQKQKGQPYSKTQKSAQKPKVWGSFERRPSESDGMRYPKTIITFHNADQTDKLHPTQKPVALFEYLIRTYTQPGDVVLDPTCGSGTTAIAARNTGRNFICGDLELKYVEVARKRLAQDYTLPMFETLGVPA